MHHFLSILMSLSCFEEKCFFIKEGSQQQVKCSPLGKSKHSSIPKVESLVAINLDFILFITTNTFPGGGAERRSLQRLSPRPGARRVSWEDRTRSPGGYQSQLLRKFYFIITFSIHWILFSFCLVGCIDRYKYYKRALWIMWTIVAICVIVGLASWDTKCPSVDQNNHTIKYHHNIHSLLRLFARLSILCLCPSDSAAAASTGASMTLH